MATSPRLPELVRDSQLEATFHPDEYAPRKTTHRRHFGRGKLREETWRRTKCLGGGGYGMVWLERGGSSSGQRSTRAVKEIKTRGKKIDREGYIRELEALAKFSQAKYVNFFVKSFGWFESKEALFIAMEYCDHGDLKNYLEDHGQLPEIQAQDISWQLVQGLVFMHENGFAHRDLKPANVLIRERPPEYDWHVKICDLGLSKRIEGDLATTTIKGTPGFMPPETLFPGVDKNPRKTDPFAGDMWCLGEIIFHILTSQPTFYNSLGGLMEYARSGKGFPLAPLEGVKASHLAIQFLQDLMNPDPLLRLTAPAAHKHLWITTSDNYQDESGDETTESEISNKTDHKHQGQPSAEFGATEQASAEWTVTGAMQDGAVLAKPDTLNSHKGDQGGEDPALVTARIKTRPKSEETNMAPTTAAQGNRESHSPVISGRSPLDVAQESLRRSRLRAPQERQPVSGSNREEQRSDQASRGLPLKDATNVLGRSPPIEETMEASPTLSAVFSQRQSRPYSYNAKDLRSQAFETREALLEGVSQAQIKESEWRNNGGRRDRMIKPGTRSRLNSKQTSRRPGKQSEDRREQGNFIFGNPEDIFEEFMRNQSDRQDTDLFNQEGYKRNSSGQRRPEGQERINNQHRIGGFSFGNPEEIFAEFMRKTNRQDADLFNQEGYKET